MPDFIYLTTAFTFNPDKGYENALRLVSSLIWMFTPEQCVFYSPIVHHRPIADHAAIEGGYDDFWHQIDNAFIERFDEVWVLLDEDGGWRVSKGMIGEIAHAKKHGKTVRYWRFAPSIRRPPEDLPDLLPADDPGIFD